MENGIMAADGQEPTSDCCGARLICAEDEVYCCQACGRLCTDAGDL